MRTILSGVVVVGGMAAVLAALFGGSPVPTCLGPLGITIIGCYAGAGMTPSANLVGPVLLAALGGGFAVLVWPTPSRRRTASGTIAGAVGAFFGVAFYAATRPLTLEGPTFVDPFDPTIVGPSVTLELPFEPVAAVAYAVAGLAIAMAVVAIIIRGVVMVPRNPVRPDGDGSPSRATGGT